MTKLRKVPVDALKNFCIRHKIDQAVLYCFDSVEKTQHMITYGSTIDGSSRAADIGNKIKELAGWDETLYDHPPTVVVMMQENQELKLLLAESQHLLKDMQSQLAAYRTNSEELDEVLVDAIDDLVKTEATAP